MKRIAALSAVLLIAGLVLTGCGASIKWEDFSSAKAGFSALMTGEVDESTQTNASILGAVTTYIYQSATDKASFTISYTQMPWPEDALTSSEVDQVLDEGVEGAKQNVYNVVDIDKKDISLDGHPGKEFEFAGTYEGMDVHYTGRVYMVGNELYQILVVSESGAVSDTDTKKFLDSFKLD